MSADVSDGDTILAAQLNALLTEMLPCGSIAMFGSDTMPDNWLLCDGQEISRATYASLFALIGTTYGVGDGSLTFNVPDFRGRTTMGVSGTKALGSVGTGTFTLTLTEFQRHDHTISADGYHTHLFGMGRGMSAGSDTVIVDYLPGSNTIQTSLSQHAHGAVTGSAGSATPIVFAPKYAVTNYCIKVY